MHSLFRGGLVLALMLAPGTRAETAPSAPPTDSFAGTWIGTVSAPNDQAEIGFTFTRGKHGLNASISMPAMFLREMDLGPAQIESATYTLPDFDVKLTLADGRLTGTFANPLLRVVLHRGAAPAPARPSADLPPGPDPVWSHALGA